MEESLERIQKWMEESKFSEAERALSTLILRTSSPPTEILKLHVQCLIEQKKSPSAKVLISLAEAELESDVDRSIYWLSLLPPLELQRHHRQIQFLKIKIADKKGRVDELHGLLTAYQIYLFEKRNPAVPGLIHEMIEKYFRADFNLLLGELSLVLMLCDFGAAEKILKTLFLSVIEKASAKGIKHKVDAIAKIMDGAGSKGYLEVYRGLCTLLLDGVTDKKNLKKLVEFIIYTEDFKFQVLALNIMHQNDFVDLAMDYASAIRENPEYDFVYFEKYYTHLKTYFVQPRKKASAAQVEQFDIDLRLEDERPKIPVLTDGPFDTVDEEMNIYNIFKYQEYTTRELFEIATSFLQSDMPKIAKLAAERVLAASPDTVDYMKACYLKLTCLLRMGDYRSAVDCALSGLDRAQTKDDILSFLYGEAEAYMRLNLTKDARRVLKEIISIDSNYRLTRERLEKLDEI